MATLLVCALVEYVRMSIQYNSSGGRAWEEVSTYVTVRVSLTAAPVMVIARHSLVRRC